MCVCDYMHTCARSHILTDGKGHTLEGSKGVKADQKLHKIDEKLSVDIKTETVKNLQHVDNNINCTALARKAGEVILKARSDIKMLLHQLLYINTRLQ